MSFTSGSPSFWPATGCDDLHFRFIGGSVASFVQVLRVDSRTVASTTIIFYDYGIWPVISQVNASMLKCGLCQASFSLVKYVIRSFENCYFHLLTASFRIGRADMGEEFKPMYLSSDLYQHSVVPTLEANDSSIYHCKLPSENIVLCGLTILFRHVTWVLQLRCKFKIEDADLLTENEFQNPDMYVSFCGILLSNQLVFCFDL